MKHDKIPELYKIHTEIRKVMEKDNLEGTRKIIQQYIQDR